MSHLRFVLVPLVAAFLFTPSARAQVTIEIRLPVIRFEAAPPLVVVSPGIQVVEDYGDEVYFVDSWYWVRHDGRWYRARDHRGGWVFVERGVPTRLVKLQPGKYKHFKGKKPGKARSDGKHHGKGKKHKKQGKGRD